MAGAARSGESMISCEIGTASSVNLHQGAGFVVSPESPFEWAEVMNVLERIARIAWGWRHINARQPISGYRFGRGLCCLCKELEEGK